MVHFRQEDDLREVRRGEELSEERGSRSQNDSMSQNVQIAVRMPVVADQRHIWGEKIERFDIKLT